MAACMHDAWLAAAVRQIVCFHNRQGVKIGSQADGMGTIAVAEDADHAGSTHAAMNLDSPRLEHLCHPRGGSILGEAELRIGMEILADGAEVFLVSANVIDDAHNHRETLGDRQPTRV